MTTKTTVHSPWLVTLKAHSRLRSRLFCFPYAGASASAYRAGIRILPDTIDLVSIQLPGRETRFFEPPSTDLTWVISKIADAITPLLNAPYAVFGHSLGAILSYEVVQELMRRKSSPPRHIIVSGRCAPHLVRRVAKHHLLPDVEFINHLRQMEGTEPEVLENFELMQLLLPSLRADFSLAETHIAHTPALLPCALSAYGGTADIDVPKHRLLAWQDYTREAFKVRMFRGGHFFIHDEGGFFWETLVRDIEATLT